MKEQLRNFLIKFYHPNGKWCFIDKYGNNAEILDIGCGNQSASITKSISPTCTYTGIDIGEYNISESDKNSSDTYILTLPEKFSHTIEQFDKVFDVVISSHNIEHTNDRKATLIAMLHSVKKGGRIYLSFPAEATVSFPSRQGTLNYYDDPTHKEFPPDFQEIIAILKENNFEIDFAIAQYRPKILYIIGAILEPISRLKGKNMLGTWAYYGFESVIHATKL